MNNSNLVYRIIREEDWKEAKLSGKIPATPIDKASGFVHLSPANQVFKTLELYFTKKDRPLLLAINSSVLAADLKWEAVAKRNGALFPHLYRALLLSDIEDHAMLHWQEKAKKWSCSLL